jgi:hypothetical protein
MYVYLTQSRRTKTKHKDKKMQKCQSIVPPRVPSFNVLHRQNRWNKSVTVFTEDSTPRYTLH